MVIALDFDNTLCIGGFPNLGEPRMWLIEKAKRWRAQGHKLILWTCREDVLSGERCVFKPRLYLTEAVEFCRSYGLEFDAVNASIDEIENPDYRFARKIFADVYIDDKSVAFYETANSLGDVTGGFMCNTILCDGDSL